MTSFFPKYALLLAISFSLFSTSHMAFAAPESSRKPNIIMVMADDLGQEALACYGNDINKTPNLDRMASEGMKFTDGHSTPLCSPSRVQLMTGKYNNRNYWVFGLLDKKQKTFATYLKEAGYVTGIAGKWQLLGNEKQQKRGGGRIGSRPEEVGFDEFCLWQVEEFGSRYKDPTISTSTGTEELKGQYGPDVFADFSVNFIRKHKEKPFFLYYPMVLTHGPFQPTPDDPEYPTAPVKGTQDPRYYPSQVAYMDKLMGRLMNEVKSQGLENDTLIIFTGDNGCDKPIYSTVDGKKIRGGKGTTTRFGTNVPLIARWPGKISAGKINDNLIDFTDMLPTFLDVAGTTAPKDSGLDGLSFYSQLQGKQEKVRDWVFCYYHPQINTDFKALWAHDQRWKLYDDGKFYDMNTDPLEEKPLAEPGLTEESRTAKSKLQRAIEEKTRGETAQPVASQPAAKKKSGRKGGARKNNA